MERTIRGMNGGGDQENPAEQVWIMSLMIVLAFCMRRKRGRRRSCRDLIVPEIVGWCGCRCSNWTTLRLERVNLDYVLRWLVNGWGKCIIGFRGYWFYEWARQSTKSGWLIFRRCLGNLSTADPVLWFVNYRKQWRRKSTSSPALDYDLHSGIKLIVCHVISTKSTTLLSSNEAAINAMHLGMSRPAHRLHTSVIYVIPHAVLK